MSGQHMARKASRLLTTIKGHLNMRIVAPVSPVEMLNEEFLKPPGLTKYRLAKDIGVPPQRIGDIVAGQRSITAQSPLIRTFAAASISG